MTLTSKQQSAIDALLTNAKQADAAAACGLHPRTLQRYMRDPEFVAELQQRQDAILHGITAALVGGSEAAVACLSSVIEDGGEKATDRIRAATFWLQHTKDIYDTKLILQRLQALEGVLGDNTKQTTEN